MNADNAEDSIFAMSLDELLQLKISVTTRTDQSTQESASAVYVITQEDIRRSGLKTIPEILRLVPGFHISRQDGNKWQINSRRNNTRFSNSMQVLMDGRTLYDSLFGGTYWEAQDTFIADIDRIEVIRGPGSSSWGANSITGVINIITKQTNQTQGTSMHLDIGAGEINNEFSIRHGFKDENFAARFYVKKRETGHGEFSAFNENTSNNSFFPKGQNAEDSIRSTQGGFKTDIQLNQGMDLTIQGDLYHSNTRDWRVSNAEVFENDIHMDGSNFMFNLETRHSNGATSKFGYIFDQFERLDSSFEYERKLHELEFLYNYQFEEHLLTLGIEYRTSDDWTNTPSSGRFSLHPMSGKESITSFVIQDQWTVSPNWTLNLGARIENNQQTGVEYNPSLRALYNIDERTNLWFAISQSSRTPSRTEIDAYLNFNDFIDSPPFFSCPVDFGFTLDPIVGCIIPIGNKYAESDITKTLEFGYRHSYGTDLSLDIAVFYDQDENPNTTLENNFFGAELVIKHQANNNWRLEYQLSMLEIDTDEREVSSVENSSSLLAHLRSYYNISNELTFNTMVYYTNARKGFDNHLRVDANLTWHFSEFNTLTFGINHLGDGGKPQTFDPTRLNTVIETGYFLSFQSKF